MPGMAGKRRRRDQIWNPPSRGVDISAIFVLFAAGPLLLPLIGAQLDVIAFFTPLVFCLFALWRCTLAAKRSRARAGVWAAFAVAVAVAAVASGLALVIPDSNTPFYVGAVASGALVVAGADLARRSLAGVARERVADGLLFPVLAVSVAIWFIVVPGFRDGNAVLAGVVVLDLIALCSVSLALVARPTAQQLHIAGPIALGLAVVVVGDSLISSDAAGQLSTSGVPTALLWAGGAYLLALAADFDAGDLPRDHPAVDGDIAAARWVIARVVLPLAAVIVVPLICVALAAVHDLTTGAIAWFALTGLVVLGLSFGRQAYLLLDNRRWVIRERELRLEVMRRNEE